MSHNTYTRVGGNWTDGVDTLTEADLESFEAKMFKSVNGDDGGTWAPAAPIVIGGSGIRLAGAFHLFDSTCLVTCDGGIDLQGALNVNSGGSVSINNGATFAVYDKVLLASRSITRGQPFSPRFTAGEFDTPTGSVEVLKVLSVNPVLCTFPLELPHGSVLTQVRISILPAGGHVGLPVTMPRLRVLKIDSTGGTTVVGSATDTSATVPFYEAQHYVALSGLSHTVDRAYRYVAEYRNEGGGFGINLLVFGHEATFTLTSMDVAGA